METTLPTTPKFSIITLSYNQRAYLERAVESVLNQGWPELEYIAIDPGSTDGSREYLAQRLANVPAHLVFAPDRGPAHGLNKGLSMVTGDIIGCLNADDAYLPGTLHRVAHAFRRYHGASVIYGDGFKSRGTGGLRPFRSTCFSPRRYAYGMATVVQQATFLHRALLGSIEFNESNHTCWDGELLVDIALSGGQLVHVTEDWGLFEIHSDSITGSNRLRRQYWADHRRIARKAIKRQWRASDELVLRSARAFLRTRNLVHRLYDRARSAQSVSIRTA